MTSRLVHTRVKRIHEDLDILIGEKRRSIELKEGLPINYHLASKKLADDVKRLQQEIELVKKNFPLYKRVKGL